MTSYVQKNVNIMDMIFILYSVLNIKLLMGRSDKMSPGTPTEGPVEKDLTKLSKQFRFTCGLVLVPGTWYLVLRYIPPRYRHDKVY